MLVPLKADWSGGWEAGLGGLMRKDGTKEFKPLKNCCHLYHRYLHLRLLSIVS